ncbi:MAG: penicillin-binding protein [Bacteroidetes bacterium]|nr:MAG: penicillin-binding protein [Bacteroidota bacterium]
MSEWPYSEGELDRYLSDSDERQKGESQQKKAYRTPVGRYWASKTEDPKKIQAAVVLSWAVSALSLMVLVVAILFATLVDELPPLKEIENPEFQLATIAYTADGKELARYALQNRSWVGYDDISPWVIRALISTEDHRFYAHWGIDIFRTLAVPYHVLRGVPQGGSTLSQQLARNLYNERIGKERTISRKLKEMFTAVQLERRYTKEEIIEMYLNTVEFGYQTYGIEAAANSFFAKDPIDLNELESATLVGTLKASTYYNPVRNPENSRRRRNTVLGQMVKRGMLAANFLETHRDNPIVTNYKSVAITQSLAPYFAERVRRWLVEWGKENDVDIYQDGLVVYTTLDSELQQFAAAATDSIMTCLQDVVAHEWSRPDSTAYIAYDACAYKDVEFEPFSYLWESKPALLDEYIRGTNRYRNLVRQEFTRQEAIDSLRLHNGFLDSLKVIKTVLQAGFVAMDPQTGHVKAWVGGRNLVEDWYDHIGTARRQPGSTFKPFVYTAAIDNGWSQYYTLRDDSVYSVDAAGNVWTPGNSEGMTGQMMTLRDGLARSKNTITAQLVLEIGAAQVAFFARRMGIKSPLLEVPSLALGTSNVTLLEMTNAYSTFANGGIHYEPTFVTRIEDKNGNALYEDRPQLKEALSESTAYIMIDMLRAVIQYGTGIRIGGRGIEYNLWEYDLAGKTGTTQRSADNWFIMMHPDLVMGAWVGFNDPRIAFKSNHWGQGAHTALHIVGRFFRNIIRADEPYVLQESRFPLPSLFTDNLDMGPNPPADSLFAPSRNARRGRVAW